MRTVPRSAVRWSLSLAALAALGALWAQTPPPSPPPATPPPQPAPAPPPAPRPPLPKLPDGARGFDTAPAPAKAAPKLIAVGGGWGAEESPRKPSLKSQTAKGYGALGKEYLDRLEFEKAIPPLEKAVRLDPDYLEAYAALGEACAYATVENDDYRPSPEEVQRLFLKSAAAFEQARRLAPKKVDYLLDLGVLYFNTGQYQKAADALREGLRLWPSDQEFQIPILEFVTRTDVYSFIGQAYHQLGQEEKAVAAFEEGLRVDPDDSKEALCWELAPVYEATGAPEKALALYARLVAGATADGERPDGKALLRIAALRARAGQNAQAAEALTQAVESFEAELKEHEQYPPDPDAEDDWKREWAEKLALRRRDAAEASFDLGAVRLSLEQPQQALPPLRRAVELAPDHAGARYDLGFALLATGDRDGARAQASALAQLAPELAAELEGRIGPATP